MSPVELVILEHMFEYALAVRSTPESAGLLDRVGEAHRAEARAAAARLVAVGELFVVRLRDSGERAEWTMDTQEAVAAQVAAAVNLQCRDGVELSAVWDRDARSASAGGQGVCGRRY